MAFTKRNITFIDGYNVINKRQELRDISKENLSHARDSLIEEMAEYKSLSGEEVTIVFDAYNLDRIKETYEEKYGMKIVYTKRFQTADSYIEREVAKIDRHHNIKVVTDDAAIQTQAYGRGALRVSSNELKLELYRLRNKIKKVKRVNFSQNLTTFPISSDLSQKIDELKRSLEEEDR